MLKKLTNNPLRTIVLALAIVVLVAGGIVYAQHRSRLKNPVIPSDSPLAAQRNTSASGQNSPNGADQTPAETGANSSPAAGSSGTLTTPYGEFVSNHHPGGGAPTAEASTCTTSPGAVCYIEFQKDGQTKKLTAQTTDAKGAAIWYWDVKAAGLGSGSWKVTAVAALDGQTKTAADSMALVVQ